MADPIVVLVGERNPYGADPYFALYPEPTGCAGWRLCHLVLGMQPAAYLRVFERRNLLTGPSWSAPGARAAAAKLAEEIPAESLVLLFGRKVWDAWATLLHATVGAWDPFMAYTPAASGGRHYLLALPHPSGLNRMWGAPGAVARARSCIAGLGAAPAPAARGPGGAPVSTRRKRAAPEPTAQPSGKEFLAPVPGSHSMTSGSRVPPAPPPERQFRDGDAEEDDAELDTVELFERGGLIDGRRKRERP